MDKRITVQELLRRKQSGSRITALTAYDYPTALLVDQAGIDIILVGDSLGMVVLGYESTIPVTMDEMLHHCRAVRRGVQHALIVGDMPFMSYNASREDAVRNAGRFIKEGGCDAVKLEGGSEFAPTVSAIVKAGIPVMAHVGLLPQTATLWSGYRVQGKTVDSAQRILDDAVALEEAGAFSIVLEMVAAEVTDLVTRRLRIPTIGIGAGPGCDGQILVLHDILGLYARFVPKFVKQYAKLADDITAAVTRYRDDVVKGIYPGPDHTFHMDAVSHNDLLRSLGRLAKVVDQ